MLPKIPPPPQWLMSLVVALFIVVLTMQLLH